MEELSKCPKCNSDRFELYINCVDYTVSKETFQIQACKNCGFVFTNPRPASNEIGKYYESQEYISHSDTNKGLINKLYHFIKKIAIKNKIGLVRDLNATRKILDIGCGTGVFLGEIQKAGWKVIGIEPNTLARESAMKNYEISVYGEDKIQTLDKNSFSVITMWHVLEHVHNLKSRIGELHSLLESGGYAIIAVPNYTSWDASHYKNYWAAYDVPRHLYHFSPTSIKELFQEFNFNHHKSIPMKFDSYYVSMLSEKYKGSLLGFIKAFFNGWTSNIKANGNPEKYSSVIYIFQKK